MRPGRDRTSQARKRQLCAAVANAAHLRCCRRCLRCYHRLDRYHMTEEQLSAGHREVWQDVAHVLRARQHVCEYLLAELGCAVHAARRLYALLLLPPTLVHLIVECCGQFVTQEAAHLEVRVSGGGGCRESAELAKESGLDGGVVRYGLGSTPVSLTIRCSSSSPNGIGALLPNNQMPPTSLIEITPRPFASRCRLRGARIAESTTV